VSDDTQESEGLARGQGSFTVHGKKASVITFGLDWHNMPAEERLKTRKQAAAHEALELGSPLEVHEKVGVSIRGGDGDAHSVRSIKSSSTATVDLTPPDQRRKERERHVSGATITPANFQGGDEADATEGAVNGNGAAGGKEMKQDDSRDEDSDAVSEMSEIKEEELPSKETEIGMKGDVDVDAVASAQKENKQEKERPAVEGDAVPIPRPVDS